MSNTVLPLDLLTAKPFRLLVGAGPSGVGPTGNSSESEGDNDDGGGVDNDADDDSDGEDDADDGGEDDDKPLGPKGERALAALKDSRKQERARRITAERENRQLKAQLARKGQGNDGGGDDDGEDEKTRIVEERVTARANQRILRAEVKAAAAGKLADPSDAHKFLDLDQFEVGEDGEVDQDEIADAIDDLIKDKPYLAAQGGTRKTPKPDRRQGGGQRETGGTVASGRALYEARKKKTN